MSDDFSGKNHAEESTPTPPSKVKKPKAGPGRPKGSKTGEAPQVTVRHHISLTQAIRDRVNPDILIDWDWMVLQGLNPVIVQNRKGEWVVEPDPSPMAQAPTLNDKRQSQQNLLNRGWGMPAQSVQIEANIKAQAMAFGLGIDNASLMGLDVQTLFAVRDNLAKIFSLPAPETDNSDAIDAEFVDIKANSSLPEGDSELVSEDKGI